MDKRILVIVESPTKAKTISKILDSPFKVVSSMGHIIDLPKSRLGIDLDNDFSPQYKILKGKEKLVKELKKYARQAEKIYLATDPDREGEAISWHIKNVLSSQPAKSKKTAVQKEFFRVVFHEITRTAIKASFSHPVDLDMNKVNAQQARRFLDRIVGYLLSPFLWKTICRGLSAGRVQSVALKFIIAREREIQKFIPKKFYYVDVCFEKHGIKFKARLTKKDGKKVTIDNKKDAEIIKESIADKSFTVKNIKLTLVRKKPYPPFITSHLQQDSFRKLNFSSSRTMVVAQRLYEGIDLPSEGPTGLITYMRTDSFNISKEAVQKAKDFIVNSFGRAYFKDKGYLFKSKGIVQAAHEAIRPTDIYRLPDQIQGFLSKDEHLLYGLIWKRFIASFMNEAEIEHKQIVFSCDGYEFQASGSRVVFDGFLKVYPERIKEELLPGFSQGDKLSCCDVKVEEKTTLPPSRFNDASLVKIMEEKGIGRPSTYAPTIYTLISRNYVRRGRGALIPTELGFVVMELLEKFFAYIIEDDFTARMEESLDYIEKGELEWHKLLKDFLPRFKDTLDRAESSSEKKLISAGRVCELCGRDMVIRFSRKGKFISCSGYPECKHAISLTTKVKCPDCGEGELIERKNRRGQRFYGCSGFPKCRYTTSRLSPQPDAGE